MKKSQKLIGRQQYDAPAIEIMTVEAEQCFASSTCDSNFTVEDTGYDESILDW